MTGTTAKLVAEKLGISISTVGRALSDDPRISAATKQRVREMADALGYVTDAPARIMRGGSSKLLGLVIPDVLNDFYASIAQALSTCCEEQGYQLALSIARDDRDLEAKHIKALVSARVAGVVIVPTASPRRETATLLAGVPHVQLLRSTSALGAQWFGMDDEACIRAGTAHLLGLGHRDIGYIGGPDTLSTGAARVRGFLQAYRDAGLDPARAVTQLGPPTDQHGYESAMRLVAHPGALAPKVSAIIAGSSHVTIGILSALKELDVNVPGTLSLVGFGDPTWARWWGPGLTTAHLPIHELATTCGLWLLRSLANKGAALPSLQSIAKSELIVRGSTAPIAPTS
ncbi:LacI family DNA-binding transcriptional regulator [Burkholderia pseudomultivorans]|uniref:LacI family DNA-binding transcriptional regulator n=1 Tax=Burkholderia pseudomultivorans TaxID=1207504 RepID=UPI00075B2F9E|nr:LacI family DNA-binding transcriptional regulator [Burkholderia pseudomultivorans]KWF06389.1 hypothetical protein WT55_21090 [Burkholderia pseudomultivorans]